MEGGPQDDAAPPTGPAAAQPTRWPWGRIAVITLVVLLLVAGIAFLLRPQNHPPTIARTSVSPSPTAEVATLLTFSAEASDPDSDALSYSWDFGDGTTDTGEQVFHAYDLPGRFIALVTVTDGKGGVVTNDGGLMFVRINPNATKIAPPPPCGSENCTPGPVVAVLSADRNVTQVGTPIAFSANASWAYAFSWNNQTNHSEGGTYSAVVASQNASLFPYFRYVWGDGSGNTTGTSDRVGRTGHAFGATGNFFVRLTVTYVNAELNPSTKGASAGFTVRVTTSPALQSFGPLVADHEARGTETAGVSWAPRTRNPDVS